MSLSLGCQIGNYRIIRLLGQGGMGAVYEVEHAQLGVHYALKTFTFEGGHDELLKNKFLAEGKVLARLQDPHLVRVFDLDFDAATDTLYFVMDLVLYKDGEPHTLADVETDDLEESYILQWFEELASALDYIHAQGIVHRDIKLNNVLLNADKHVILSDFGVSRFFSQHLRNEINAVNTMISAATTGGHIVMGTRGYMAPEVERGEEATTAADVYSLGVMLMYLLTGIWYDSGSKVLKFLDTLEYPWKDVLPKMLAEDPFERPPHLMDCVRRLKAGLERRDGLSAANGHTSVGPAPRAGRTSTEHPMVGRGLRPRRTRTILIAASLVLAAAVISVVVLVSQSGSSHQASSQHPDQNAANLGQRWRVSGASLAPRATKTDNALQRLPVAERQAPLKLAAFHPDPAQIQPPALTDGDFASFFNARGVYEVQK